MNLLLSRLEILGNIAVLETLQRHLASRGLVSFSFSGFNIFITYNRLINLSGKFQIENWVIEEQFELYGINADLLLNCYQGE